MLLYVHEYIYEIYIQGVTSPEAVVVCFSHIYSLDCLNKFINYKNELNTVMINLLSPSYNNIQDTLVKSH